MSKKKADFSNFLSKLKGFASKSKSKKDKSVKDDITDPTVSGESNLLQGLKEKFSQLKSKIGKDGDSDEDQESLVNSIKEFDWFGNLDQFFSPMNRAVIHKTFITGLVAAGTYGIGKTTAVLLQKEFNTPAVLEVNQVLLTQPKENFKTKMKDVEVANLFNTKSDADPIKLTKKPKKKIDDNKVCISSDKTSTLPVKLMSTIVLQDSVKSLASVQVRGSQGDLSLREGDKIEGLVEIGRIGRQKLIFKNLKSGNCEFIENADKKLNKKFKSKKYKIVSPEKGRKLLKKQIKGISNEGNRFVIKKKFRDTALKDMSKILTQARAVQIRNSDGSFSFKMTEIEAGSIYSALDIQDGDIIDEISGKKITNLNEIMTLFGKIKDIDQLELTVRRNGISTRKEYEFK